MDNRQNEEFTELLRSAVGEAEKLKYKPRIFKRMLEEHGGFEAVNRVLASGRPSEGFERLWELNRLDLTCEAIIVETKWRRHFDAGVLAKAEKLLGEMRYPFKRYEGREAASSAALPVQIAPAPSDKAQGSALDSKPSPGMRINAFFRDVLKAPVANVRWSWGAVDERTRRVFLRLWRMDVVGVDGAQIVRVLADRDTGRLGWIERARHVELIRAGYAAYGVLCDKESPHAGAIADFDRDNLLRLGRVIDEDGMAYLEIVAMAPIDTIAKPSDRFSAIGSDLRAIEAGGASSTTREALVDARLGQGRFRRELLRRWNGACAVTGCRVAAVLRASHCKPWSESADHERLDSNNGLVLSANLDALFDAGLISFDDSGDMLVANALSAQERLDLALPSRLRREPGAKLRGYLRYHRQHVFRP